MRPVFSLPGVQSMKLFCSAVALLLLATAWVGLPAMAAEDSMLALSIASEPHPATAKTVQAKLMINAPPQLVWQTLINYSDIKKILPGYERSTVLKANGNSKILDIGMKVAAFLPTYHYQVQTQEDQTTYNLSLKRISGDFKALNAHYKLVAQNNGTRTLLIYNLELDTGINLPGSQGIIKSNTERSMKALERHIEQEARKSLIGQR